MNNNELLTDPPLISVVMCAYNAGPFLEAAVNSVLQQTYTAWELLISDDGSTDGTREWLRRLEGHPKVRLFFQEKNLGYVANKNFVHRQARGEYITQQDNDDTCDPDRLERQIRPMLLNRELKITACGYTRIDEAGLELGRLHTETDLLITEKGPGNYPFWFPSLLVHRSVFEAIGYFDPYFAGLMGDDLYWTVKANERYPIWCLAAPLYHYRHNPGSITNIYNNRRKLIITTLIDELFRQRKASGTDWLEKGDREALAGYETRLLNNRSLMGEQYRIWAAKAIDKYNWPQARELLKRSYGQNPVNPGWYRTFIYYLRRKIGA